MTEFGKYFNPLEIGRNRKWRSKIVAEQTKHASRCLPLCYAVEICPICSGRDSEPCIEVYEYPYLQCRTCRHIFCALIPHEDAIESMYAGDGNDANAQHLVYLDEDLYQKRVDEIAAPKVSFAVRSIEREGRQVKTWVDVGSGVGDLLMAAKNHTDAVWGIESDVEFVEWSLSRGLKVKHGMSREHLHSDSLGLSDIVSYINVLEHIRDPATEIGTAVSTGAEFILVEVPRHPSIATFTSMAFPNDAYRHIYPPDHLHIFSDESLRFIFERHGYYTVNSWYFGQDILDLMLSMAFSASTINSEESMTRFIGQNLEKLNNIQAAVDQSQLGDTVLALFHRR